MCRNIKTLFNFEPPATEDEIHASAIQFVRKLSGFNKPSKANEEAFNRAVEEVHAAARTLVRSLVTAAPPRDREVEKARLMEESRRRFGKPASPEDPAGATAGNAPGYTAFRRLNPDESPD